MSDSIRLDAALVSRGMIGGRDKAKAAIAGGHVFVNGRVVRKPSVSVTHDDEIVCDIQERFVGRGGEKLLKVLEETSLAVTSCVCADIGASTGGFTDCLLQHGADRVFAVDVGHDQLALSLRNDPRVVNMEGVDVRHRDVIGQIIEDGTLDICTVDVSFISITHIFESIVPLLKPNGQIVCLIKPQFEAGREALSKRGVVRRDKDHVRVLQSVLNYWQQQQWAVTYLSWSPVRGGEGNIEYIAVLNRTSPNMVVDVPMLVQNAFRALSD